MTDREITPDDDGLFRCFLKNCTAVYRKRSSLGVHLSLTHGWLSTDNDSINRAKIRARHAIDQIPEPELRDRFKAYVTEIIDEKYLTTKKSAEMEIPAEIPQHIPPTARFGPLDVGDTEILRRRLVMLIAGPLARELNRQPHEICVAIATLAANRFVPRSIYRLRVPSVEGYTPSRR